MGQRTEAVTLSELVRRGYRVLLPFGVNQRYDLVIDREGEFIRAQCKTGRLVRGAVVFNTQSIQSNTRKTVIRGYATDADLFLVYCAGTGRIYAVPVEQASGSHIYLRVDLPQNGQARGIHWARDYELPA